MIHLSVAVSLSCGIPSAIFCSTSRRKTLSANLSLNSTPVNRGGCNVLCCQGRERAHPVRRDVDYYATCSGVNGRAGTTFLGSLGDAFDDAGGCYD